MSETKTGAGYKDISLFTSPLQTVWSLVFVLIELLQQLLGFILRHAILITVIIASVVIPHLVDGPHSSVFQFVTQACAILR
jgi:hypothetical protein